MHGTHHMGQDCTITHSGIEHPHCRRSWVNICKLQRSPLRDHPFFGAGVDKQQIFLTVVVKAERALIFIR
jgi:hypothetical protein